MKSQTIAGSEHFVLNNTCRTRCWCCCPCSSEAASTRPETDGVVRAVEVPCKPCNGRFTALKQFCQLFFCHRQPQTQHVESLTFFNSFECPAVVCCCSLSVNATCRYSINEARSEEFSKSGAAHTCRRLPFLADAVSSVKLPPSCFASTTASDGVAAVSAAASTK